MSALSECGGHRRFEGLRQGSGSGGIPLQMTPSQDLISIHLSGEARNDILFDALPGKFTMTRTDAARTSYVKISWIPFLDPPVDPQLRLSRWLLIRALNPQKIVPWI